MADETPAPKSTWGLITSSRKGLITLLFVALVVITGVLLEIAIFVMTLRGKMSVDSAIQTSMVTVLGGIVALVPTIVTLVNSIAKEDAAAKLTLPPTSAPKENE